MTWLGLGFKHWWRLVMFTHKNNSFRLRKSLVMLGFKQDRNSSLLDGRPVCLSPDPEPPSHLAVSSFVQHCLFTTSIELSKTNAVDFTLHVHYNHVCLSMPPRDNFGVWKQRQKDVTKYQFLISWEWEGAAHTQERQKIIVITYYYLILLLLLDNVAVGFSPSQSCIALFDHCWHALLL